MEETKKQLPEEHAKRLGLIQQANNEVIRRIHLLNPANNQKLSKKDKMRICEDLIMNHITPLGNALMDLYVHAHKLGEYFDHVKIETNKPEENKLKIIT